MNYFNGYNLTWNGTSGSLNGFDLNDKPSLSFDYDELNTVNLTKTINGETSNLVWAEIQAIISFFETKLGSTIRLSGINADGVFVASAPASSLVAAVPGVPASLAGEKWVWQNGTWVDGRTTEELGQHLTDAKTAAKKTVAKYADAMSEAITGVVPMAEQLSWPTKEEAALAYQNSTATAIQIALLEAEAQVTGEAVGDLVTKILSNANLYHTAAGLIAGQRRKVSSLIDAAIDEVTIQAILDQAKVEADAMLEQLLSS